VEVISMRTNVFPLIVGDDEDEGDNNGHG